MKEYPKTIEEAVDYLIEELSVEDISKLKNTKEENLILYHHTLGRSIRNNFGLWKGNKQLKKNKHPDDISQKIIVATWKKLNEKTTKS